MAYTPLQLAEAFIQAGELADAADALTQHLDSNPDDDSARRLRAQVLARLPDEADLRLADADLSQLATPTTDDAIWRSIVLQRLGDNYHAAALLAELHENNPENERIAERYFDLLLGQGKYAEAQFVRDQMPDSWDWLQRSAILAESQEQQEQAVLYLTQALADLETRFDLSSDAFAQSIKGSFLNQRAHDYLELQRFPEAEVDFAAAEALLPDDPSPTFWHGLITAELGDIEQGLMLCRTAFAKASDGWRAQMIASLKVIRDDERYRALADAILAD
jgi:tetratricopeptide (TPR) repeat protein